MMRENAKIENNTSKEFTTDIWQITRIVLKPETTITWLTIPEFISDEMYKFKKVAFYGR